MHKRLLFSLLMVLSLVISPFMGSVAQAISTLPYANALVKIDGSPAVYWVATNGKRYVFPNPRTFYSWFSNADLASVITLSPQQLGSITIGGNVTYRPGVRLIKVTTDPRVYAVARYGTLRWITSEALAQQLYGQNWAQQVDDVPDEFFTNYTVGDAIYTASQFNPAFELGQARTPSENVRMGIVDPLPPRPGSVIGQARLRISNATPRVGDTITYTADLVNTTNNAADITITIVSITGETLRTCTGTLSCTHNLYIGADMSGFGRTYYANATHRNGHRIGSEGVTLQVGGTVPFAPATAHTITFNRTSVRPGEAFTVTSRLTPDTTNAPYYTIRIYDQWNVLQHTCVRVRTCVLQQTLSATTDASRTYYASAVADTGHSIGSGNATIQVTQTASSENGRLGSSWAGLALSPNPGYITAIPLTLHSGTKLTITSDIQSPPTNVTGFKIHLYQTDGILLKTCANTTTCSVEKVLTNASESTDVTYKFYARVEDVYGASHESSIAPVIVRRSQQSSEAFSATLIASASPSNVESFVPFTLTAEVKGYNIPMDKIGISWYQEDGALIGTCTANENCLINTSYGVFTGTSRTMKFYFTAWDISGVKTGTLQSGLQTVTISL